MADRQSNDAQPVTLDIFSLEVWGLQGSGYCVRLAGEIDDSWIASFTQAQQAQSDPARFYLDRARRTIVFSTRAQEDPQRLISEARALLDLANRRAGRQVPQVPVDAARPGADEETRRLTRPKTPVVEVIKKSGQGATTLEDSRGSSRIGASLMVEFCAGGNVGPDSASTGMTRDLSETGVFIQTSRLPIVGERLYLTVHLAPQKHIDLTGEVVRVLGKDEARQLQLRTGFAARVMDPSENDSFHRLVRSQLEL